ncbi:MAG: sulfotransferase [Deltaproteobacteria bacterium]|nr:sulfotransferase [Deltaproteobacteria bacterium]
MVNSTFQNSLGYFGSIRADALERLIYVVGFARGGTSVFRDALDIHDQILMLPEMTHFLNQVWRYRSKVHQRLLRQVFRLPSFYREEAVLAGLPEDRRYLLQRHIDQALSGRDLKRMWQIYPLIYALDPGNHKKGDGILAWGDKANDFHAVEDAAGSFPEGKFIMLLRDPRSVGLSQAKRAVLKETRRQGSGVNDLKLVEACVSWRNMAQRMLVFAKRHRERTMLVRFEDFLAEPEATLNRVFAFTVGLPLEVGLLRERLGRLTYGATNDPSEKGAGLSTRSLDRWKTLLTEKQVALVAGIVGPTAKKAGYELSPSGKRASLSSLLENTPTIKQKILLLLKIFYLQVREACL